MSIFRSSDCLTTYLPPFIIVANGITLGGFKFMTIRADDEEVQGRKGVRFDLTILYLLSPTLHTLSPRDICFCFVRVPASYLLPPFLRHLKLPLLPSASLLLASRFSLLASRPLFLLSYLLPLTSRLYPCLLSSGFPLLHPSYLPVTLPDQKQKH